MPQHEMTAQSFVRNSRNAMMRACLMAGLLALASACVLFL